MHRLSIQSTVFTASQADDVPSSSKADIHDIRSEDRSWPKADPEDWSFSGVKASALEKSGHSGNSPKFSQN
jgi:hypothetical protein